VNRRNRVEQEVTALIKTFERPKALAQLVRSVRRFYPHMLILVGDDSFHPTVRRDVTYIRLPPDTGLSAGRNELLRRVQTPYFLLLDDDMEFTSQTDIPRLLETVKTNDVELAGGNFMLWRRNALRRWYQVWRPRVVFDAQPWNGVFYRNGKRMMLTPGYVESNEGHFVCDFVNNFFVAETDAIRRMGGWDDDLKVYEHWDFFIRFKNAGMKAAYCSDVTIRHWHTRSPQYTKFRLREEFRGLAMKKHDLESFVNHEGQRFVVKEDGTVAKAA